jgi:hypothetical protein
VYFEIQIPHDGRSTARPSACDRTSHCGHAQPFARRLPWSEKSLRLLMRAKDNSPPRSAWGDSGSLAESASAFRRSAACLALHAVAPEL